MFLLPLLFGTGIAEMTFTAIKCGLSKSWMRRFVRRAGARAGYEKKWQAQSE
jgi:hypothetical protein